MYVQKYSVKNQEKITVGFLNQFNFYKVAQWFLKFAHKEETIVKVELSAIDIEKIFSQRLFFKNDLIDCTYEEMVLEDVLNWNIYIPHKITKTMLGHPIVLKRKLTHDDLHNSIYCFKGTLKAIEILLNYNKLAWSSKANRTDRENRIISSAKNKKDLSFFEYKELLINELDYEIIDKIFDVETMELLLEDEEVPFKELINQRLIEFTESQDQNPETSLDDYQW